MMINKDLSPVRRRAARDLSRLVLDAESVNVDDWTLQDSAYQNEFLATAHLLADMEDLSNDPELRAVQHAPASVAWRERKGSSLVVWSAAAAILLAVTLGLFTKLPEKEANDVDLKRYSTRVGEQKTVNLNDGSVVTLNTGTRIIVQMSDVERKVTLEQGEIFLDVAKHLHTPFTVDAGFRSISVIGTRFNVNKLPDKLQIGVTEGAVVIHSSQESPSTLAPKLSVSTPPNARQYQIVAGWVAEFNANNQHVTGYAADNIASLYQWRTGVLDFDGAPLVDVVKELNRYSGKKILIEDGDIVDLKVRAVFQIDRLDMALDGLTRALPIKATYYFDRIVLARTE